LPVLSLIFVSDKTAPSDPMTAQMEPATAAQSPPSRASVALTVAGITMLALAGLLLWAKQSESVFAAYLVSAVQACF
jgi:hypothetical protein